LFWGRASQITSFPITPRNAGSSPNSQDSDPDGNGWLKSAWLRRTFENGTWHGEIRREFEPQPGEIVAMEHPAVWCMAFASLPFGTPVALDTAADQIAQLVRGFMK